VNPLKRQENEDFAAYKQRVKAMEVAERKHEKGSVLYNPCRLVKIGDKHRIVGIPCESAVRKLKDEQERIRKIRDRLRKQMRPK
jgi:hypothetical protein